MDYRYIVPTGVPESEHPYAGLFLGVVPEGRESAVARHVFDDLGARFQVGIRRLSRLGGRLISPRIVTASVPRWASRWTSRFRVLIGAVCASWRGIFRQGLSYTGITEL